MKAAADAISSADGRFPRGPQPSGTRVVPSSPVPRHSPGPTLPFPIPDLALKWALEAEPFTSPPGLSAPPLLDCESGRGRGRPIWSNTRGAEER